LRLSWAAAGFEDYRDHAVRDVVPENGMTKAASQRRHGLKQEM